MLLGVETVLPRMVSLATEWNRRSWLNQVKIWFSILPAKALAGASFTSPRQVRNQIDAFMKAYNQTAHPFEWTKQVVFSQHPRAKYADLCN